MKILSNKNYNRLVNATKINNNDDALPLLLENKDMELKIESIRNKLVDLHNEIKTNTSKDCIKNKIKSIIEFIERGKE